jgi:dUTP pyrophosphatase
MQKEMKFIKTREVKSPTYGTPGSAGIDFFVPTDFVEAWVYPHQSVLIPSGIKARVPDGYALIAFNKSGVATKKRLQVGAQVVDSDYEGEIHIHVYNTANDSVKIGPGDKLIQFILLPVGTAMLEECNTLEEVFPVQSARGSGGFGSTDLENALESTR